jgi:hypothetical protein
VQPRRGNSDADDPAASFAVPPDDESLPSAYDPYSPAADVPDAPSPYGSSPYGSSPYGSPSYGSPSYGSPSYGSSPYGSSPYGSSPYGSSPYGSDRSGEDGDGSDRSGEDGDGSDRSGDAPVQAPSRRAGAALDGAVPDGAVPDGAVLAPPSTAARARTWVIGTALAILILVPVAGQPFTGMTRPGRESFAELAFQDPGGLPSSYRTGGSHQVVFRIRSAGQRTARYTYVIAVGGREVARGVTPQLRDGGEVTVRKAIRLQSRAGHLPVEVRLVETGDVIRYWLTRTGWTS